MNSNVAAIRKANWTYRAGDWIYKNNLQIRTFAGIVLNTAGLVGLVISEGMAPGTGKNWAMTSSAATGVAGIALEIWAFADYHTRLDEANKKLRSGQRNERITAGNSYVGH